MIPLLFAGARIASLVMRLERIEAIVAGMLRTASKEMAAVARTAASVDRQLKGLDIHVKATLGGQPFNQSAINGLVDKWKKQVNYATAVALTRTARQAALDVQQEMVRYLDRPTPFTVRSVAWAPATKLNLASKVYLRPVAAEYLKPLIAGGTVYPKRRAIVEPVDAPLNAYGGLQRSYVARMLRRPDVFSGRVGGIGGLWRRVGRNKLELLVKWESSQERKAIFPFKEIVERSVARNFDRLFSEALAQAKSTMR